MRLGCIAIAVFLTLAVTHCVARAQVGIDIDIEQAPFSYSDTEDDNRVSRLIDKLNSKQIKLEYTREHGYLRSLLEALQIPESSQTLVFSKTSMQVRYISRRNPRAIYFNDDTYVGWVNGSSLMEISTADPKLGAAFYTVDMAPWHPKMQRANYDCLGCHATSMTRGIPGHTVRSVLAAYDGSVDSQRESFITDDSSPFRQRWGGWYVTGLHGDMQHMGNTFLRGGTLDTKTNGNRLNVRDEFDSSNYLSAHSDIVALMVLEHQTQMHNAMVQADFAVRHWLHQAEQTSPSDESEQEWRLQLHLIAKEVVDRMLFCDEAPLTSEVKGSVLFANDFTERGPKDEQGRSLREFDLTARLFKYPVSFLIYSDAFDALQPCLRKEIYRQLHLVLSGESQLDDYKHLSSQTRFDALAILRATKTDLPF
jgi:hypothetical protein